MECRCGRKGEEKRRRPRTPLCPQHCGRDSLLGGAASSVSLSEVSELSDSAGDEPDEDEDEDVASSDEYPNDFLNLVNSGFDGLPCFAATATASRRALGAAIAAMLQTQRLMRSKG